MYALERRVRLKSGQYPEHCWARYVVSANRPLMEKVRAGQPIPKNWRVVSMVCSMRDAEKNFAQTA